MKRLLRLIGWPVAANHPPGTRVVAMGKLEWWARRRWWDIKHLGRRGPNA